MITPKNKLMSKPWKWDAKNAASNYEKRANEQRHGKKQSREFPEEQQANTNQAEKETEIDRERDVVATSMPSPAIRKKRDDAKYCRDNGENTKNTKRKFRIVG
jgi:hypothetical protein